MMQMQLPAEQSMPTSVFIFIPAYGEMISATTFLSTHAILPTLSQKGIGGGITTLSFPDIAELRNIATTIWYDKVPTSHLLFVDADMGFGSDILIDMLLLNEPLVGALYRHRRDEVSWAGSGTGENFSARRGLFMEVEGVGMGVTLIRRDCITTMLQNFPEMVDKRIVGHPAKDMLDQAGVDRIIRCFDSLDIPERGKISEDLSFCMRWRQCGGKVWASIGHNIVHVGKKAFSGCFLEHAQQQQQAGNQVPPVSITSPDLLAAQMAAGIVRTDSPSEAFTVPHKVVDGDARTAA
jgi:hypothetical protein